ncbi:mRNA turnover protein [Anaeramoeba flamelloides]|uniref:mRNA turnover protein n=1 Tax=Anaeramoeba flamelloides TaxID=1746091 RepID=A0ABQ8YX49_9EUKA|nr:mRNA turnover protein [Anaeramoeba flamelloides]
MPRSGRRNKKTIHPFNKTQKKGREAKKKLIDNVQLAVQKYESLWTVKFVNFTSNTQRQLRTQLGDSQIINGKKKVMAYALGKTKEEEIAPGLNIVASTLKLDHGLLATNLKKDEALKIIKNFKGEAFARCGEIAQETFVAEQGKTELFTHSMVPYLQKLGLPVILKEGIISLTKDHRICTKGEELTSNDSRLLV